MILEKKCNLLHILVLLVVVLQLAPILFAIILKRIKLKKEIINPKKSNK